MGNVIAFLEYSGSSLRGSALAALNAARQVAEKQGGQVIALLAGKDAKAAASDAAKYAPKVLVADDAQLEHYLAETYAPILVDAAKANDATAVLAAANNLG